MRDEMQAVRELIPNLKTDDVMALLVAVEGLYAAGVSIEGAEAFDLSALGQDVVLEQVPFAWVTRKVVGAGVGLAASVVLGFGGLLYREELMALWSRAEKETAAVEEVAEAEGRGYAAWSAIATSRVKRNAVPSHHMRWSTTPIRRARATVAHFPPRSTARGNAQAFSQFGDRRYSITVAVW